MGDSRKKCMQLETFYLFLVKGSEHADYYYGVNVFSQVNKLSFWVFGLEKYVIQGFDEFLVIDLFEEKCQKLCESFVDIFVFFDLLTYLLSFLLVVLYTSDCFLGDFVYIFSHSSANVFHPDVPCFVCHILFTKNKKGYKFGLFAVFFPLWERIYRFILEIQPQLRIHWPLCKFFVLFIFPLGWGGWVVEVSSLLTSRSVTRTAGSNPALTET